MSKFTSTKPISAVVKSEEKQLFFILNISNNNKKEFNLGDIKKSFNRKIVYKEMRIQKPQNLPQQYIDMENNHQIAAACGGV
jgi:hypothetical protein